MKHYVSCSLAGVALLANTAFAGGYEGYGVPNNMTFYGGQVLAVLTKKVLVIPLIIHAIAKRLVQVIKSLQAHALPLPMMQICYRPSV